MNYEPSSRPTTYCTMDYFPKWRIGRQHSRLIIMILVCSSFQRQLDVQAFSSSLYELSQLPDDAPYVTGKSWKDKRRRLTFTLSGESTSLWQDVRGGGGGEGGGGGVEINNSTNNVTTTHKQDEDKTGKSDGTTENNNESAVELPKNKKDDDKEKNQGRSSSTSDDNQVLVGNEINWDDVRGRENISEDKADAIEKDLFLESFREQVQQISQQIQADTMNSFAVLRKEILRRKAQQRLHDLAKHEKQKTEPIDPQSVVDDNDDDNDKDDDNDDENEEEDLEPLDSAEGLKRDILLEKDIRRKRQKLSRAQQLTKKKATEQLHEETLPTIQEETAEPELMDDHTDVVVEKDLECHEGRMEEKISFMDEVDDFIVGDTDEEEESVLDRMESHKTTESATLDKEEHKKDIGEPEPLTTVCGGVKSRVKRKTSTKGGKRKKKKKKKKKSRTGIEVVPTVEIKTAIDEKLLDTKRPKPMAISESIRTVVLTGLMLLIVFLASLLLKIVTKTTTTTTIGS